MGGGGGRLNGRMLTANHKHQTANSKQQQLTCSCRPAADELSPASGGKVEEGKGREEGKRDNACCVGDLFCSFYSATAHPLFALLTFYTFQIRASPQNNYQTSLRCESCSRSPTSERCLQPTSGRKQKRHTASLIVRRRGGGGVGGGERSGNGVNLRC